MGGGANGAIAGPPGQMSASRRASATARDGRARARTVAGQGNRRVTAPAVQARSRLVPAAHLPSTARLAPVPAPAAVAASAARALHTHTQSAPTARSRCAGSPAARRPHPRRRAARWRRSGALGTKSTARVGPVRATTRPRRRATSPRTTGSRRAIIQQAAQAAQAPAAIPRDPPTCCAPRS